LPFVLAVPPRFSGGGGRPSSGGREGEGGGGGGKKICKSSNFSKEARKKNHKICLSMWHSTKRKKELEGRESLTKEKRKVSFHPEPGAQRRRIRRFMASVAGPEVTEKKKREKRKGTRSDGPRGGGGGGGGEEKSNGTVFGNPQFPIMKAAKLKRPDKGKKKRKKRQKAPHLSHNKKGKGEAFGAFHRRLNAQARNRRGRGKKGEGDWCSKPFPGEEKERKPRPSPGPRVGALKGKKGRLSLILKKKRGLFLSHSIIREGGLWRKRGKTF